jgi:cysteate synthase
LFDALSDTNGDVLTATNREAREAVSLFEETEGIDIYPAAGVATATLIQAVKNQSVDKNALILLNITGGGENLFRQEKKLHYLKPERIFSINPDSEEVKEKVASLF